jgi:hypothetical protein
MANTVLVQTIDEVQATGMIPGLHKVRVKATHNVGATHPRLVPMPSEDPSTLRLGFYVDQQATTMITHVQAELELTGFLKVCVKGEKNEICEDVPQ